MRYILEKAAHEADLASRNAEISALENEVVRLRHELAAAHASIKKILDDALALDAASQAFIKSLVDQIVVLQGDVDVADEVIEDQDEVIDTLEIALLRRPPPSSHQH